MRREAAFPIAKQNGNSGDFSVGGDEVQITVTIEIAGDCSFRIDTSANA